MVTDSSQAKTYANKSWISHSIRAELTSFRWQVAKLPENLSTEALELLAPDLPLGRLLFSSRTVNDREDGQIQVNKEQQLVIFDLDGVLVDTKQLHFQALNEALAEVSPDYVISDNEHSRYFDGLDTTSKLKLLSEKKGLPHGLHEPIWLRKQKITKDLLGGIVESTALQHILYFLKDKGIKIGVASNAIRETVEICLDQLGIASLVDFSLSNEDVLKPKPHPEIYWRSMIRGNSDPSRTVILEDSSLGRKAALSSGAKVIPVKTVGGFQISQILERMHSTAKNQAIYWEDMELNVLIPMAGLGSRFKEEGYSSPKPLIDVHGKPMIQVVVENLGIIANYIFVVQKEDSKRYNMRQILQAITPGNLTILEIDGQTEGTAVSALMAENLIDVDQPLLIVNSDQFLEWDSLSALYSFQRKEVDVGILTFESSDPKWSYVLKNPETKMVERVEEKNPISKEATCGVYYWSSGRSFVRSAKEMILKNLRVNDEFYIAPSINELISEGAKVVTFEVERMWGLGTPQDLRYFLTHQSRQFD